jgi:hypothetical protein
MQDGMTDIEFSLTLASCCYRQHACPSMAQDGDEYIYRGRDIREIRVLIHLDSADGPRNFDIPSMIVKPFWNAFGHVYQRETTRMDPYEPRSMLAVTFYVASYELIRQRVAETFATLTDSICIGPRLVGIINQYVGN